MPNRYAVRIPDAAMPRDAVAAPHGEERIECLIDRLPARLQTTIRRLRRPSSRRVRLPAGVLLIGGGLLSILPVFGIWMLPLGLMLLAEDVPPLRRTRDRLLDAIERRRPNWFAGCGRGGRTRALPARRKS